MYEKKIKLLAAADLALSDLYLDKAYTGIKNGEAPVNNKRCFEKAACHVMRVYRYSKYCQSKSESIGHIDIAKLHNHCIAVLQKAEHIKEFSLDDLKKLF